MQDLLEDKIEKTLIDSFKNFKETEAFQNIAIEENSIFLNKFKMAGKHVLELGCGICPTSFGIKNENMPKEYVATDFSYSLLNLVKQIDGRVKTVKIDLHNLTEINTEKKYDLILLKGVLHHIKDFENVLIFCHKILKLNGSIIIAEPNLKSIVGNFLKFFLKKFFKINTEDSPYGQIPYDKLIKKINDANYKIVNVRFYRFLAFSLSGDLGRINMINNKIIINIAIYFDRFLNLVLNKLNLSKFIFFIANFEIKKK